MGNEPELARGPVPAPHQLSVDSLAVNGVCAPISACSQPVIGAAAPAAAEAGGSIASAPELNGKRKRGRPPKAGGAAKVVVTPAAKRIKNEEEDVCFICFDGGSLVLCDRRDCPKAYHPACVRRDESFFTERLRWNCGWHLCNICQKNALFMCYTCPYSLCKTCVKQADISCVRGNKGFCKTCMSTISLIENNKQGNGEVVNVDFDDATSWEYLFKVYWVLLKQKESLTWEELTRATNPWKDLTLNHVNNHVEPSRTIAPLETNSVQVETNVSKRRKTRKQPPMPNHSSERIVTYKLNESDVDWASKELLEFVAYVKNGDTSKLTQFDVQALLLEYIRKNKLRDPRRKCQVICDKRLEILFGKARLDHFEMLKLLEYHIKDGSRESSVIRAAAIDSSASQMKLEECSDESNIVTREKKRPVQKPVDERKRKINLDNFAAIDVHNMSLIYLRRTLMENLLEDAENFHDKVVGSIVRIRISDNDLKQEMYRLVQVVGTGKAVEPYKVGDKTSYFILKILNLDKIEDVRIDAISNQELSEDECIRLRENIKCGLVEKMTVGEVQKKAIALQEVRIKDVLETEIMKLNHVRDRASEMGHRKELRECVEKLELLKSPQERLSRMLEIPEVHADPRMDPVYQSDENSEQSATKEDVSMTPVHSISNSSMELIARSSSSNWDVKRNVLDRSQINKEDDAARSLESSQSTLELEKNAARILEELRNQVDPCRIASKHEAMTLVNHPRDASDASVTSCSQSVLSPNDTELEKIWHYQDPSGKVQGPFCMLQLRKWNSDGYFPTDLRIWRVDESHDKSVLLTDACSNPCNNEHQFQSDCLESQEPRFVSDCRNSEQGKQLSININAPWTSDKPNDGCNSDLIDAAVCSDDKRQPIAGENSEREADLHCSSQVSPNKNHKSSHVVSSSAGEVSNACLASSDTLFRTVDQNLSPKCSDLPAITPSCSDVSPKILAVEPEPQLSASNVSNHMSGCSLGISSIGVKFPDTLNSTMKQELDHENSKLQAEESKFMADLKCVAEEHNQPVPSVVLEQGNDRKATSEHAHFSDIPNQPPELNNEVAKSQAIEFKEPVAPYLHRQESFPSWHALSSGVGFSVPVSPANQKSEGVKGLETELCLSSNATCQDNGFSWSSAASLECETGQWAGYSIPPKSCVAELDSGMKFGDHVTTTAGSCQFTQSLTTQLDCNTSSWHDGLIELSTLGDESVSDLLSEVELMESMHGLPSPNSRIFFGDDPMGSPSNDCFGPLVGLNLPLETGRHDAWNAPQPTITDPQPTYTLNLHDCPTKEDIRVKQDCASAQQDFLSLTCTSLSSSVPAANSVSFGGLHSEQVKPFSLPTHSLGVDSHGHPPTSLSLSTLDSCSDHHKMEVQAKLQDISNSLNLDFFSLLHNPEPSESYTRSRDTHPAHVSASKGELASPIYLAPPPPPPPPPPPAMLDTANLAESASHMGLPSPAPLPAPTPARLDTLSPKEPAFGYVSTRQEQPGLRSTSAPQRSLPFPLSIPSSSSLDIPSSPVEEGEVEPASLSLELSVNVPASHPSPKKQASQTRGSRKMSSFGEEGKVKPTADSSIQKREGASPRQSSDALLSTTRKGTSVRESNAGFPTSGLSPRDAKSPSWATSPGTAMLHRSSAHSAAIQGSRSSQQPRFPAGGGGRHNGQNDRSYHQSVDPGFVKAARPSWQRQSSFSSGGGGGGSVGGGGYSRQPPASSRGQRVCKFYESGYCKKGATCAYLHP